MRARRRSALCFHVLLRPIWPPIAPRSVPHLITLSKVSRQVPRARTAATPPDLVPHPYRRTPTLIFSACSNVAPPPPAQNINMTPAKIYLIVALGLAVLEEVMAKGCNPKKDVYCCGTARPPASPRPPACRH